MCICELAETKKKIYKISINLKSFLSADQIIKILQMYNFMEIFNKEIFLLHIVEIL